jgi:hypothetical protein
MSRSQAADDVVLDGEFVLLLGRPSSTMASLVWRAGRRMFAEGRELQAFGTSELLAAFKLPGPREAMLSEQQYDSI